MPKYIDAEKFAEHVSENLSWNGERYNAASVISDLKTFPVADVEPKQRWIPVTEDTPHSIVNKVLVFCHGECECVPNYVGFAHFEKYHGEEIWYNLETGKPFEEWGLTVTHWMDKPLPPKEDKSGEDL